MQHRTRKTSTSHSKNLSRKKNKKNKYIPLKKFIKEEKLDPYNNFVYETNDAGIIEIMQSRIENLENLVIAILEKQPESVLKEMFGDVETLPDNFAERKNVRIAKNGIITEYLND